MSLFESKIMEVNNQNRELLYQKQIVRSLQDQQYNSVKVIRQAVRLRSIKYWVQSGLYTGIYQLWQPHIFLCFLQTRPDQTRPGQAANKDLYFIARKSPVFIVVRRMGSKIKKQNRTSQPARRRLVHRSSGRQFAIKSRILVNSIEPGGVDQDQTHKDFKIIRIVKN